MIAALQARLPTATFTGLGGSQMARQHQQQIVRAEDVAVMGVTEILRHVPHIYSSYRRLVRSIRRDRPSIAILIDFPDVNFRLARHLRRAGVPVVWLVSPQLWAWKRRRLRWVQQRVDKMLVIFPFEATFYRERGVDAEFIGHPLLTPESTSPALPRETYAAQHGLDPSKTWIALLPGSRWKEIHANLPALHELAMSDLIATAAAETTFLNGAEAMKAGFEKAIKGYDTVLGYGKDTVEAYMKSATVAGKGIETINSEIYSFSKDAIEESIAASKAILGSKSIHEAFELQTDYAKSAFESYVGELTKVSELFTSTTKSTFAPLQGRVQAWVEVVQSARAA